MEKEILGYMASGFVLSSLVMSNMKYLRYLNLIGSLLFVVYGFVIQAYPVVAMNVAGALLNIFYLWKIHKKQKRSG